MMKSIKNFFHGQLTALETQNDTVQVNDYSRIVWVVALHARSLWNGFTTRLYEQFDDYSQRKQAVALFLRFVNQNVSYTCSVSKKMSLKMWIFLFMPYWFEGPEGGSYSHFPARILTKSQCPGAGCSKAS